MSASAITPSFDDYDYEDENDSSSGISGIVESLIPVGTSLASSYIQNSEIAANPTQFQQFAPPPVSYQSNGSSSLIWIVIAVIAVIFFWKVL